MCAWTQARKAKRSPLLPPKVVTMRSLSSLCVKEIASSDSPSHSFDPLERVFVRYVQVQVVQDRLAAGNDRGGRPREFQGLLIGFVGVERYLRVRDREHGGRQFAPLLIGKIRRVVVAARGDGKCKGQRARKVFPKMFHTGWFRFVNEFFSNVKIEDKNRITMKSAAGYKHLMKKYHSGRPLFRRLGFDSGAGRGVWGRSAFRGGVSTGTGTLSRVKMVLSHPIVILFNPSAPHSLQNLFETSIFTQHKRSMPPVLLCGLNLLIICNP